MNLTHQDQISLGWMLDSKSMLLNGNSSNVDKLLDAKVERCRVYNSDNRDEIYNQITITYKEDTCKQ